MADILPKCKLCGHIPEKGLRDGFFLLGAFFCSSCEQKIVLSDVDSDKEYAELLDVFRTLPLSIGPNNHQKIGKIPD